MNNRKIAIIGCGSISHTHIAAIQSSNLGEIVALCDIRADRLASAAALCPHAATYGDYTALLRDADCDVVHICTPHYLHAEIAIAALNAGHDVYLEKPCALNRREAETILAAEKQSGKRVCVSFQNRLNDTTIVAKRYISDGTLGKLCGGKGLVAWHREGAYYSESGWRGKFATEGGGVLMNQAIHTLDLLQYFLGKPLKTVGQASLYKNFDVTEVEDTATAYITFENGASATFYATTCNTLDSSVELELYFEKGTLRIQDETLYLLRDGTIETLCENDNRITGKACWGSGHVRMISAFYNALDGKECEFCPLSDAVTVLDMIADIYRHSTVRPTIL